MTAVPDRNHRSAFGMNAPFQVSWLEGVTEAARRLLACKDFDAAVNGALEAIATACDIDRVYILENHIDSDTGDLVGTVLNEWMVPSMEGDRARVREPFSRQTIPYTAISGWLECWYANQPVQALVSQLAGSTKDFYAMGGSLLTVPILLEGTLWGVMGFDCAIERVWSDAEIAILETAAANVAGALQLRLSQTELENFNQQLRQRDALLNSVNAATQCLVASDELEKSLPSLLKILGEGTNQCRAYILQISNVPQTGELLFNLMLEWDAPDIPSKIETGGVFPVPVDRFPHRLTAPLRAGQATQFLARDLDGFTESEPGQALSLVGVPISVAGEWWGLLGLDDCIRERIWSDAEVAVLETAATAIGSAIERDRARQEKEQAAQQHALELSKTNDAIGQALRNLAAKPEPNEFLGSILAEIAQRIGACKAFLFLYEDTTHSLCQQISFQDGRVYVGPSPADPDLFHHPIPADFLPVWDIIINSSKPLTLDETFPCDKETCWPGMVEWHRAQGHLAVTCIPMRVDLHPLGFMGFCFRKHATLTDEQLEFMQALTNQAIVSIQLTRLAEQSQNAALTDERNRLAREIHDTLAQSFTAVSLQLEVAKKVAATSPEAVTAYLENAGKLAREGLREARRSVRALRPEVLETGNLTQALHQLIQLTTAGTQIEADVKIEGTARTLLPDVENNLLRIAQEAFTNAIRHGRAKSIRIQLLFEPDALHMRVTDNGIGFDPQQVLGDGVGLIGMQERSQHIQGQLIIDSEIGRGTDITVSVAS